MSRTSATKAWQFYAAEAFVWLAIVVVLCGLAPRLLR